MEAPGRYMLKKKSERNINEFQRFEFSIEASLFES